ncbi:DUF6968 family protein [Neisseria sp. CP9]|uniref:DUF6968 family protein n=1 Tax=Neisseria sp. CP9 TaxID=3388843 RepID=UPI0039EEDAF0
MNIFARGLISKYDYVDEGRAIGEDMLQAIYLAMIKLGVILSHTDFWKKENLSWNGDKNLGFPSLDNSNQHQL